MTGPNQPAWDRDSTSRNNLYSSLGCSAVHVGEHQYVVQSERQPFDVHMQDDHSFRATNNQDPTNTSHFKNPTNSLWLGSLDVEAHRKDDLKAFFSGWQGFLDIHIPEGGGNFGFARFETAEDAIEAKNFIARRLHLIVCGKPIKVNFGRQMSISRSNADSSHESHRFSIPDSGLKNPAISSNQEPHSASHALAVTDFDQSVDEDAVNEMMHEVHEEEHEVHHDVIYYEKVDGNSLGRNDIDEVVGKVDRVRRNSGREELRDCMKRKRSKAKEVIQVIIKRIHHLYSRDTHKKLLVLYGVGDFFYALPPHRRYDVGTMIGEEIIELLSSILLYQCDVGKKYVSDVAASLYFYFIPSVRRMMEDFIDIELLIELQQEESPPLKEL